MTKKEAIERAITVESRETMSGGNFTGDLYYTVRKVSPEKLAKFLDKFITATPEQILEVME